MAAALFRIGSRVCGQPETSSNWSDTTLGYDRVIERIAGPAISLWYFRGENLVSVDVLNDPRAFQVGKRLLEMGKSPSEDSIREVSSDLKILLRR